MEKKLYKSSTEKKICGVCGGIAKYFNIDPTVVRLGAAVLTVISVGTGLIAYVVAAIVMPEDPGIVEV